ncbi:hypothetical protein ACFSQE_00290 [Vogesella fluminis]|uniref:hypothetical protein n=1 Tax=Vogesella fluminis TaxID=1069161 RepID=UPI0016734170|nr:hypothetical protein [Vogesella fluminis]
MLPVPLRSGNNRKKTTYCSAISLAEKPNLSDIPNCPLRVEIGTIYTLRYVRNFSLSQILFAELFDYNPPQFCNAFTKAPNVMTTDAAQPGGGLKIKVRM